MKTVNPNIYTEKYYLSECLGSCEFTESGGKKIHPQLVKMLSKIKVQKRMHVLDIGCGRGDITMYLAKKAKEAIGIDYSSHAIKIAQKAKKSFPDKIQENVKFYKMNAKKMRFADNYFDLIICIDVFEHLYPKELQLMMGEIKRVLKPKGTLFVHTGTNPILYDYTYKYYILPMNKLLTWLDKKLKKRSYDSLPNDPRTLIEKEQHVNEPTYHYLSKLFKKSGFSGDIHIEIGYIKPVKNLRTRLYNALIALYPISKYYPLNLLFGWSFVCSVKNEKKPTLIPETTAMSAVI